MKLHQILCKFLIFISLLHNNLQAAELGDLAADTAEDVAGTGARAAEQGAEEAAAQAANKVENIGAQAAENTANLAAEDVAKTGENVEAQTVADSAAVVTPELSASALQDVSGDLGRVAPEDAAAQAAQASADKISQASAKLTAINAARDAVTKASDVLETVTKKLAKKTLKDMAKTLTKFEKDPAGLRNACKSLIKKLPDEDAQQLSSEVDAAYASKSPQDLAKVYTKLTKLGIQSELRGAVEGLDDSAAESTDKIAVTNMVDKAVTNVDDIFTTVDDALDKGTSLLSKVSKKSEQTLIDQISEDGASQMSKDIGSDTSRAMEDLSMKESQALEGLGNLDSMAARWGSRSLAADSARFGRFLKNVPGKVGSALKAANEWSGIGSKLSGVAETLFPAVLFMIPNIFESSFLAQKQKQVVLQTLAKPIAFGDWVLQIPDSCFNLTTPSLTFPIYVKIPVSQEGETIDLGTTNYFGGASVISGPTTNNLISRSIHSAGAFVFSFGSDLAARPKRYKFDETQYFPKTDFVVSYAPPTAYTPMASAAITSSQFTGLLVDLNTGYVMDASGEQNSAVPVIDVIDPHGSPYQGNPPSIKDFLPSMLSKLGLSSAKVTYTEYEDIGTGSSGAAISATLQSQFDCACLAKSADTTVAGSASATCPIGTCLITSALNAYMSGLYINSNGTVGISSTATPAATAATKATVNSFALGSVIPMYGWGTTGFDALINATNFPDNTPVQNTVIEQLPKAKSGHGTFWPGSPTKSTKTTKPIYQYADATENYQAQGCWVYICANTPFAKAVQQGLGSQAQSPHGPFVDYIIFLDELGQNQLPLMVAAPQPIYPGSSVSWPAITLNPKIKYWTSLVDPNPVMYDLQGNQYENPALAGKSGVIQSAITELQSNSSNAPTFQQPLYAQFMVHSQALLSKYMHGPFPYGNVRLTESKYSITSSSATINLYTGMNCYASGVPDLLIPEDPTSGNTVTLPNPGATVFYSLVTDISYQVQADGSLKAVDFSQAPLTKQGSSYVLNSANENNFNVLSNISQVVGSGSNIASNIQPYVAQQRAAWIANFDNSKEAQGIDIGSIACKLATGLSTKQAIANDCYIYEVTPSPSAAVTDQDLYVLTSSAQPTLETLVPLSVQSAGAHATVVSLLTGCLYDTSGNPIIAANGKPQMLGVSLSTDKMESMSDLIYQYVTQKFPVGKGTTQEFKNQYQAWVKNFSALAHRPMGPYSFGSLHLGIFYGDLLAGNNVYFDAAGMNSFETFEPQDMFITVDLSSSPIAFGKPFDDTTQYVMSLVSGQLYSTAGPVKKMSQEKLLAFTQQLSSDWGPWLQDNLERLQKESIDRLQAQKEEQEKLDAAYSGLSEQDAKALMSPAVVKAIIQRLTPSGTQGLTAPYQTLKYDPVKQIYVRLSPASSTDTTSFVYQFFDVPNSYTTSDGKPIPMGAVFNQNGQQVRVIQGIELQAAKDQYGVIVNSDGTQKLGVPLGQPSLLMTEADQSLVAGQDGDSLIVSTSPDFPGKNLTLSKGYYLYYSKIMGTYYAFEVATKQWISINGGNLYHKDGTPVAIQQKVAINSDNPTFLKFMLPYQNVAGYTQAYIDGVDYKNVNNSTGTMTWMGMSGSYTTQTVTENATGTSYSVGKNVYTVDTNYVWEPLILVPIDNDGGLISNIDDLYNEMQLILKNNEMAYCVFHGETYQLTAAGTSGSFTMVPLNMAEQVATPTLSLGVDADTKAPYITVAKGKTVYKYGFIYDQLTEDQQASYQASRWFGSVVACPISFDVGPLSSETKTIAGQSVTISVATDSTHNLFVQNIKSVAALKALSQTSEILNAPTSGPEAQLFGLNLSRIFKLTTSTQGRFFASIYPNDDSNPAHGPVFDYVSQQGYVDLLTGALFDENGISMGYSLNLDDWLEVLNKVQVTVTFNAKTKKYQLSYRNARAIKAQTVSLASAAAAVPQKASVSAA